MAAGIFAFLLSTDRGFSHRVHVCDGNGAGLRRISERRALGRPSISPDGQHIVFPGPLTDDSEGRFCLYVTGVDGSGLRRLTTPRVADADPAWSPNGTRIAFVRDPAGAMDPARYRLHLVPPAGGTATEVVSTQGAREPAWSPDSQRLAFVSFGRLYAVGADGTGLEVLADGGARAPAWSPDGTQIAYVQQISSSRSRLVSIPAAGGPLTVRADLNGQVEDPTWADANLLTFLAYQGQGWDGRTGTGIWRVTSGGSPEVVVVLPGQAARLGNHLDLPPASPIALTASEVTQRTVRLRWLNPSDPDLVAVEVRMLPGATPPASGTDGVLVYSGRTPEVLVVDGIDAATTYSFSAFARDRGGNRSAPATVTVVTPPPGVPDPPTSVEAVGGRAAARISWTAPLNDGGHPITGYTVVQDGTTQSTDAGPSERSVVVKGLTAGQTYLFSVFARNLLGPSAPATTNPVVPDNGVVAGTFLPLSPQRLVDTRPGRTPVVSGTDLVVPVAGRLGVPAGATAGVITLVATGPIGGGFLLAYPAGTTRPTVSTLNYLAGQTVANLDVVRLGGGAVAVGVGGATTHVVADIAGCYVGSGGPAGGRLNALTPSRVLDTRRAGGTPLAAGGTRTLRIAGAGGVPADPVGSVVLVLTAVDPSASTYLSVYPSGEARPTASVLNAARGQTVAVLVFARVGPDGSVVLFNHAGTAHVVADVLGYHTATAAEPGEVYSALAPSRVLDTRSGVGARIGTVGGEEVVTLSLHGAGGVPSSARTVLLNLTATQPSQPTYLTVYPADRRTPEASVLNVTAGRTVANLVLAKLTRDGRVAIRNAAGAVHLVADVRGYYSG